MRLISTLFLLLCSTICFSQIYDLIRKVDLAKNSVQSYIPQLCGMKGVLVNSVDLYTIQQNAQKKDTVPLKFFTRCSAILNSRNVPLIVIDGVPLLENKSFSTIDTSQIERIEIVKSEIAAALYGSAGMHGVIWVTTKKSILRKFIIKDFLDGNPISGATVSFISADKRDTIMLGANDSGMVVTDKIKGIKHFEMSVSAVGYKSSKENLVNVYGAKNHEVFLERDVKVCNEVFIPPTWGISCGRYYKAGCGVKGKVISTTIGNNSDKTEEAKSSIFKIFPNPVQRGKPATIETTNLSDEAIVIKLIGLDGKLLLSQNQKAVKGLNRFIINTDPRWSAGIYIVQIYANGELSASEKIVIQ